MATTDEASTSPEEAAATEIESTGASDPSTAEASEAQASETSASASVSLPEFATLKETAGRATSGALDRFYDVQVPVWAELGRIELPLGELVKLSEGAVVRLERPISEPVDLVSQGVKLARGEVIVVDDCFAIRIKEIVSSK